MLSKENWQEIATRSGIEADKLQELISSEKEEAVEFSKVTIFTDDQLDTLKQTVGKESAKTGSKTLIEMDVKALREKNGLEFEGKTIENLMNAFADKQVKAAKVDPNKKVEERDLSIKNLQKTLDATTKEKDGIINGLQSEIGNFKVNGELAKHLPDGLTVMNPNQFTTLAKNELNFGYNDDGIFVAKRGDKVLKDNREMPLAVKDVLTDFARDNKWLSINGRGGEDDKGGSGGFKTLNDVMKHMDENNINPMGADGQKLVADFEQSNK